MMAEPLVRAAWTLLRLSALTVSLSPIGQASDSLPKASQHPPVFLGPRKTAPVRPWIATVSCGP